MGVPGAQKDEVTHAEGWGALRQARGTVSQRKEPPEDKGGLVGRSGERRKRPGSSFPREHRVLQALSTVAVSSPTSHQQRGESLDSCGLWHVCCSYVYLHVCLCEHIGRLFLLGPLCWILLHSFRFVLC